MRVYARPQRVDARVISNRMLSREAGGGEEANARGERKGSSKEETHPNASISISSALSLHRILASAPSLSLSLSSHVPSPSDIRAARCSPSPWAFSISFSQVVSLSRSNVCRWVDRYLGREFWQCDPPIHPGLLSAPQPHSAETPRRVASITVSCKIQFPILMCTDTVPRAFVSLSLFLPAIARADGVVGAVSCRGRRGFQVEFEVKRRNDSAKFQECHLSPRRGYYVCELIPRS